MGHVATEMIQWIFFQRDKSNNVGESGEKIKTSNTYKIKVVGEGREE